MPLFFKKDISTDTKLGIWKIEEDEDFFLQAVLPQRNVSHPHKRLQHLAGRYLLQYLFQGFPLELIKIADTRKPFLEDEAYHFSISHCGNYAAAIVSKTKRVGVDIELPTNRVEKIKHKFLSGNELEVLNAESRNLNAESLLLNVENKKGAQQPVSNKQGLTHVEQLTLLWSCKEAVYKWFGWGMVDFKEHIVMQKIKQISAVAIQTEICFQKEDPVPLTLYSHYFTNNEQMENDTVSAIDLVMSYVVT